MFQALDSLLHSQLRLSIMSFLVNKQQSNFLDIKSVTRATSGNISVQLKKLEQAKYIKIKKGYKENYHHTKLAITKRGIKKFDSYAKEIRQYLKVNN